MALINCPECGKLISLKANNCIGCGATINNILSDSHENPYKSFLEIETEDSEIITSRSAYGLTKLDITYIFSLPKGILKEVLLRYFCLRKGDLPLYRSWDYAKELNIDEETFKDVRSEGIQKIKLNRVFCGLSPDFSSNFAHHQEQKINLRKKPNNRVNTQSRFKEWSKAVEDRHPEGSKIRDKRKFFEYKKNKHKYRSKLEKNDLNIFSKTIIVLLFSLSFLIFFIAGILIKIFTLPILDWILIILLSYPLFRFLCFLQDKWET